MYQEFEIYKPYMDSIPPIDIMPTTEPGLIQHINDIGNLEISSGFIYSGEFSDELAYNQDMLSNIKVLSEVYDTGDKEAKYTKGAEFRSSAISGQPVSALLVGSPGHLLYDKTTKKKFEVAFMSKLARRSWFCYTPENIEEPTFDSVSAMLKHKKDIANESKQARAIMQTSILDIAKYNINKLGQDIKVSEEVFELFETYLRYNNDLVDSLPNQESTYALIRRHLQWKALKLAGAFALLDKSDVLTKRHYIEAMRFAEMFDADMEHFERDMNKSNHERFADYLRTLTDSEGVATISIHDTKKQGFIEAVNTSKLQELITLCAGYDTTGVYSLVNQNSAIQYERIIKTDVLKVSFMDIDNTALNKAVAANDKAAIDKAKQVTASLTRSGYNVTEATFEELGDLLQGDYAYSPFVYKDNTRGRDNIIGGTKWVVFDVDKTVMSIEEAHFTLSAYNHHISLSSDPDNKYKYRILIELDSFVNLDPTQWRRFYKLVAEDLGLNVDLLPQAQPFFSYSGRQLLSNLEGEPLEVRQYVMKAKEHVDIEPTRYSSAQMKAQLSDPMSTFLYCYEAPLGTGSLNMYRMLQHAKRLGATMEEANVLIDNVNEYWSTDKGSMDEDRIAKLKDQCRDLYLQG